MEKYKKVFESENIYYIKLNKTLIEEYLKMVNDPEVSNKKVIILKPLLMKKS